MLSLACFQAPAGLETHYLRTLDRRPQGSGISAERGEIVLVTVNVRDNNVDQALKVLKKKMQREGLFREMKLRRDFEKPSEKKKREKAESVRRWRKMERKKRDRD